MTEGGEFRVTLRDAACLHERACRVVTMFSLYRKSHPQAASERRKMSRPLPFNKKRLRNAVDLHFLSI